MNLSTSAVTPVYDKAFDKQKQKIQFRYTSDNT